MFVFSKIYSFLIKKVKPDTYSIYPSIQSLSGTGSKIILSPET